MFISWDVPDGRNKVQEAWETVGLFLKKTLEIRGAKCYYGGAFFEPQ